MVDKKITMTFFGESFELTAYVIDTTNSVNITTGEDFSGSLSVAMDGVASQLMLSDKFFYSTTSIEGVVIINNEFSGDIIYIKGATIIGGKSFAYNGYGVYIEFSFREKVETNKGE